MKNPITKKLIPLLLFHANKEPDLLKFGERGKFYAIKNRILEKNGKAEGYDLQHIKGKKCHSCGGSGMWPKYGYNGKIYDYADCWHCYGGWYKLPQYNVLERVRFGRFIFHQPKERFYSMKKYEEWRANQPNMEAEESQIEGYIEHSEGNEKLAELFWLLYDPSELYQYYTRKISRIGIGYYSYWWRPYNFIHNLVGIFRRKWVRRCLVNDILKWMGKEQISYSMSYEDNELPF